MFKIMETYFDEFIGRDVETWRCMDCGFTTSIISGGDVAECPNCIAREAEADHKEDLRQAAIKRDRELLNKSKGAD